MKSGGMKKGNSTRTGSPPKGVVGVVKMKGGFGRMGPAQSAGGKRQKGQK